MLELVRWTDPRLHKVTFIDMQLILDAWQITQCEGVLKDGTKVQVSVPFKRLPRYGFRRAIIQHAKAAGVYAKGLGVLDAIK